VINFSHDEHDLRLRDEALQFVKTEIIPFEKDPRYSDHGPDESLRVELNERARRAHWLAPQVSPEFGGRGLSHIQRALVFEASGYSILGPIAMHCAAPDEGNMHLLEIVASPEQRKAYLAPLAQAHWRSCFAMTEPPPGAGSDPGQLNTRAQREGDHYVIEGRKWLITGADQAGMAILMARAFDGSRELGPTMFLTELPRAGVRIVRLIDSMDSSFSGGHAELALEGLRVHQSQILGEVGQGLKYAQVRLAPARLTHCMRWLGSAVRAQEIALTYANTRTAFGQRLLEHGSLAQMLARNEIDIHACRQLILHTAWLLDQGKSARHESSMVKAFVSETLFQVADRCLQLLGGLGVTRDTQVERIFREIRAFRIYDGPTEVHHWAIARRLQSQHATHGSAA